MLIELPDGSWIDPEYIRLIIVDLEQPPRVCLHVGLINSDNIDRVIFTYQTKEEAINTKDQIVERILKAIDLKSGADIPEDPQISPLKGKGSMMWRDEH